MRNKKIVRRETTKTDRNAQVDRIETKYHPDYDELAHIILNQSLEEQQDANYAPFNDNK